jgi:plastocyanin
MSNRPGVVTAVMCAGAVTVLMGAAANQDLTDKLAVQDAVVNFGAVPPQPVPVPPSSHVLDPDEVTIFKGGTVTFIMNGIGHGVAVYRVSKDTTRAHIEAGLCQGGPTLCNGTRGTGALPYKVFDGHGNLVIDIGPNPPENRINYAQGQLWSAGAGAFLTGSDVSVTGTQLRYRFEEDGRYLVVCMNRPHTINDWMFGFVNVV